MQTDRAARRFSFGFGGAKEKKPLARPLGATVVKQAVPALAVKNLSFAFGGKQVLQNVSFAVPHGGVCGLFGPNGSGKTTLFRCCLGRLAPQTGAVYVDGLPASGMSIPELAKHMAYVPQENRPGFPFSVRDVVGMGRTPHMNGFFRLDKKDARVVEEAMDLVGIRELSGEAVTDLSGGQRQLVGLARALAQEASLMLLDEPTSALDFSNQTIVWQALRRIAAQGTTVLVCCHDPNHILWFCDDVVVLRGGEVLAAGRSAETLTADVLQALYGQDVEVCFQKSKPMVRPKLACFAGC